MYSLSGSVNLQTCLLQLAPISAEQEVLAPEGTESPSEPVSTLADLPRIDNQCYKSNIETR